MQRLCAIFAALFALTAAAESTCYGTVANGRIEGSVALPASGPNFAALTLVGEAAARTYVHSTVRDIVVDAYRQLEVVSPQKRFVYGDAGWQAGGGVRGHRTHQNGLAIDFMVPVLDANGRSVPLPANPLNRFGYGQEFDAAGHYQNLTIDFDAMANHLYELDQAARRRGSALSLVFFEPTFLPRLFATARGDYLKQQVNFVRARGWGRSDDHYHVEFAIKCRPLN